MADLDDLELPSLQKLQSAEQMELLDVVDSLRACGLSEIVALPQLIVCGDQSSGKSSVLEAISGIPFPKQDTLCTRFATEVILRRAAKVQISVSIVPGEDRPQVEKNQLLRFHPELKTKDDFGLLFGNARNEMGLSSSGKSFTNDILRIEFCGPSQPQLTLVDLPGLIHSETESQTAEDVRLVHSVVSRYLENPRSIMLAVVSAKNDVGNQIILRKAREVDPQGLRTLGIITKPDILVKGSKSEDAFIKLARNEDVKFALGWHVVKNLDSAIKDSLPETRDQQETLFFQESGFTSLPAHATGITFLRARLSKVLFNQIRRELPRLVEDIETQMVAAKLARDKLGPSRSKPEEQRKFLISLSQTFQAICRDAVKGDYEHEFFQGDSNPERRLCANVMNLHFDFAKDIRKNGCSWSIDDEDVNCENYRSREDAIEEACALLKRSRGRELPGLPNPLLVGELFRHYSRPWEDLARTHIKKVWERANRFLELLLRHLADEEVCENIFRFWLHPIMEEKLSLAYSKLDELLEVHKDYPMTTNSQFISNSRATRQGSDPKNLEALLRRWLQSGEAVSVDELAQMMSTVATQSNLDMDILAAEEAFDNMNAYYEVAMNLFTDNVPTLAIRTPIIREVPKAFCPTAVDSMDSGVVSRIAGETEEKVMERESVMRRLVTLEKGALLCKQYAKRPQQVYDNLSEIKISELSIGSHEPSVKEDRKSTPIKPGKQPSIFGQLAAPSSTTSGSGVGTSSSSTQKAGTHSIDVNQKPPTDVTWEPKPSGPEVKYTVSLFGNQVNGTKPSSGGLFGHLLNSPAPTTNLFGAPPSTKPASENKTNGAINGSSVLPTTPYLFTGFGALETTPKPAADSTSTGGTSAFTAGFTPAKNLDLFK